MKTALFVVMFLFVCIPSRAAEPLSSRCMSIPPLCTPGTQPICLCENDMSFNCRWMCGSL